MLHLRDQAAPYLSTMEQAIFDHSLRRLQLEMDWHDELLDQLPKLLTDPAAPEGGPANG
jgi:hypothetical protein